MPQTYSAVGVASQNMPDRPRYIMQFIADTNVLKDADAMRKSWGVDFERLEESVRDDKKIAWKKCQYHQHTDDEMCFDLLV